jgi:hypothetical protein
MKKYDKVYVKGSSLLWLAEEYRGRTSLIDKLEIKTNAIVCTPEDLKAIWDAGWRAKHFENNSTALYTDFKDYMKHKGVEL